MRKLLTHPWFLAACFALALFVRFLVVPNPGFEADVSFWKSWGLAAWDHGVVWSMHNTNNNYPTPFAYVLGLMVAIYSRFADPHVFDEFWRNTNVIFLAVSKLFPIAADVGIAVAILFIGRNAKRLGFPSLSPRLYHLLAALFLLNPIAVIDGAWWGQVDSLGVFLFLGAMLLALTKRPGLAGALFMLAMMTKLQNMIYGPLFFLFLWQTLGYQGLMRGILGAVAGFVGLNIEFFAARDVGRVVQSLTENFDYFPYLSLNAFNLWWIVSGGAGMKVIDKIASVGIVNAKTMGLLLFSGLYLFAVLRQLVAKNIKEGTSALRVFLEGLIVVNAAFFLFMTQSHDRYAFPLSVFLLLWAPFYIQESRAKHPIRRFGLWYGLFTILYFYNLHTALVLNYPKNGLPILSSLIQAPLTIAVSVLLLTLFFIFLFVLVRTTKKSFMLLFAPLILWGVSLIVLNMPLIQKKPVSLTKLTPFDSRQDYGGRTTNMAVNGSFGSSKWARLSVQYAFYDLGIGTHANSTHVYDINRKFRTFSFDYGIDTEAGAKGTAVFEVYGDGKLLFRSEKIGRYDLPRHAEVDVAGVKRLGLVTTDADDGITDDHTDWLNPILLP
jgi:Gpi18-like mannosyltransferase